MLWSAWIPTGDGRQFGSMPLDLDSAYHHYSFSIVCRSCYGHRCRWWGDCRSLRFVRPIIVIIWPSERRTHSTFAKLLSMYNDLTQFVINTYNVYEIAVIIRQVSICRPFIIITFGIQIEGPERHDSGWAHATRHQVARYIFSSWNWRRTKN